MFIAEERDSRARLLFATLGQIKAFTTSHFMEIKYMKCIYENETTDMILVLLSLLHCAVVQRFVKITHFCEQPKQSKTVFGD